ncbi:MAG: GntR family transcriptional regulator [Myxococcales bacterium]|nr:GntR family transcriptional regulator [Myxococcales bacterium]
MIRPVELVDMGWTPQSWNASHAPAFLGLGRELVADIRRGRLVAGEQLPSTRSLARDLGIHPKHRNCCLR